MARRKPKHGSRNSLIGSISVLIVVALVGFLFVVNMQVNRTTVVSSDTAELVENQAKRASELTDEVNELSTQVDELTEEINAASKNHESNEAAEQSTILPAVEGNGISVTLNDSSMWKSAVDSSGTSADIDKYVVHQQDLEAVINALWAGGAEAMEIMGQRVLPTTAPLCSGNVLLIQGQKYAPPFVIEAIGPQSSMRDALDASPAIQIYKEYVTAFGLGYEVQDRSDLSFKATSISLQPLQYAKVLQ